MTTNSKIIGDAYAAFVADDNKAGWCARSFFKAGYEAALSQQSAQELIPYAYIRNELGRGRYHESWALCGANADGALPLYTSPPNYEALCAENEALKLKLAAMEPKP